jgi:hypothetical protein
MAETIEDIGVTITDAGTGSIDDFLADARQESEKEAAKEAPKKRAAPRRSTTKRSLKQPLTDLYGTLGAGVFILNQADGIAIISNAEKMAESLDNWGKVNPAVYKVLERLCSTGAFGAVAAAHAPVIMAILNNHNVISTIMGKDGNETESNKSTEYQGAPTVNPENPEDYVAVTGRITPLVMEPR